MYDSVCLASSLSIHQRVSCEHSALSCILQLPVSPLCWDETRKKEMKKEEEGATIRRKGSSLASEMSVNASRTLSTSSLLSFFVLFPSFLLSFFWFFPSETGNFHVSLRWCRMIAILTVARTLHGSRPVDEAVVERREGKEKPIWSVFCPLEQKSIEKLMVSRTGSTFFSIEIFRLDFPFVCDGVNKFFFLHFR